MSAKVLLENIMPSSYPLGMTETEEKAFRWLLKQGVDENDIQFSKVRSPDFITPLGDYEVKKLYKAKTLDDYVYFHREQYEKLLELNSNVIVFSDDSDDPHLITTMEELEEQVRVYIPPKHDMSFSGFSFKGELGFFAQVTKGGKITIPHEIRKLLGIEVGDMVDIQDIRKEEPGEVG